ncbi:complement C1q-like protein 3 [Mytilus edulis]|uniref:complement C1q-like protein 3 n=1 Tax=Mytilus edulis TaxID=6550 RepID=UPI0039F0C908
MFILQHLPIVCLVLSGHICVVISLCSSKLGNLLFDDLIGMMLKLKGTGHVGQGNASIQKDTPAFSAYLTSAQTASANAIVKFDKLWTNTMNAYDVTTGVFTAPIPGLYHFAAVLMSVSGKSLFLHLWHNDTNTAGSFTIGDGHKTGSFDVVFKLKKGDRVYIRCSSSCNGQKIYSSNNNYSTFSGYLIAK